ncbi:hypothetical protein SUGI_1173490 [Cryptomeria japonica]|nr:hypothetical protein SUGI_1173490 [Cryptomeria japonica]
MSGSPVATGWFSGGWCGWRAGVLRAAQAGELLRRRGSGSRDGGQEKPVAGGRRHNEWSSGRGSAGSQRRPTATSSGGQGGGAAGKRRPENSGDRGGGATGRQGAAEFGDCMGQKQREDRGRGRAKEATSKRKISSSRMKNRGRGRAKEAAVDGGKFRRIL